VTGIFSVCYRKDVLIQVDILVEDTNTMQKRLHQLIRCGGLQLAESQVIKLT